MALMTDMVARLQARIPADTAYPFDTPTLEQFIDDAVNQHNPMYDIDTLPEQDEYLIIWLSLVTVYLTLAAKYAEDFSIQAGTDKYDLDQPHVHYMDMADKMMTQYTNAMPSIQVTTARRYDLRTGVKTRTLPGDLQ